MKRVTSLKAKVKRKKRKFHMGCWQQKLDINGSRTKDVIGQLQSRPQN